MKKLNFILAAGIAALATSTAAQAADLMINEPAPMAPAYSAPGGGWDGPYIGVFGGFGMGLADHTNGGNGPCGTDEEGCDIDLSGALLGVDVGANFYLSDKVVGGIAGDVAWTNISGEDTFNFIGDSTNSIDWQGSIRGVLGMDAGMLMPYLTGGVAFAQGSHYSDIGGNTAEATHVGWTAGLGVAIKATDNMSVNLEYRHNDFGNQTYDHGGNFPQPDFTLTSNQVTVGLHFMM